MKRFNTIFTRGAVVPIAVVSGLLLISAILVFLGPRSVIEILIPGDAGSNLASIILWQYPGFDFPAIYLAAMCFVINWLTHSLGWGLLKRTILGLFVGFCLLLYTDVFVAIENSRELNPNEQAVDQLSAKQLEWINHLGEDVVPGKTTREEYDYRCRFCDSATNLLLSRSMTVDEFDAVVPAIEDYFKQRDSRYEAIAPLHQGDLLDRIRYRLAVNEMNGEATPLTFYMNRRDQTGVDLGMKYCGPIILAIIGLCVFGLICKHWTEHRIRVREKTQSQSFDVLFQACTHGRIDGWAPVEGRLRVDYPKMYIDDIAYDLRDAHLDPNDSTRLILRNGKVVKLLVGTTPITPNDAAPLAEQKVDPPSNKTGFEWDYEALQASLEPPKPVAPPVSREETAVPQEPKKPRFTWP